MTDSKLIEAAEGMLDALADALEGGEPKWKLIMERAIALRSALDATPEQEAGLSAEDYFAQVRAQNPCWECRDGLEYAHERVVGPCSFCGGTQSGAFADSSPPAPPEQGLPPDPWEGQLCNCAEDRDGGDPADHRGDCPWPWDRTRGGTVCNYTPPRAGNGGGPPRRVVRSLSRPIGPRPLRERLPHGRFVLRPRPGPARERGACRWARGLASHPRAVRCDSRDVLRGGGP